MRVLSGIQSSGRLHLGNYFGALRQHIELQHGHECFYFIANYHSLTTVHNADQLRKLCYDVALDYLALGLDPGKALLFLQSDVPEVTELTWLLSTVTGAGLLQRAHSYKDKINRGMDATMGLMSYPILMAADILIYKSELVPVGQDQVQHIEMARDMVGYFNNTFGCDVFVRPKERLNDSPVVPGVDGNKMSKSYGNTVDLFCEPKVARERIMQIKTDSASVADTKNPDSCSVFSLLRLLADEVETEEWRKRYLQGGVGYGEVKKRLFELYEKQFAAGRERRQELAKDLSKVDDILRTCGRRARAVAREVLDEARAACGLINTVAG